MKRLFAIGLSLLMLAPQVQAASELSE